MKNGKEKMEKTTGLNDWVHLLHSSSPSLPQPSPATFTTHTNITSDDFLSIFPPINHEGLPVHSSPLASHPNTEGLSTSSLESPPSPQRSHLYDFSGSSNCHRSHSLPSFNSPVSRSSSLSLRTLTTELLSLLASLPTRILPIKSKLSSPGCGGTITAALLLAFGMWKWWQRRKRRTDVGTVTVDRVVQLNLLIRQKDEKINELLNQIAQLNRILIARYKVPLVNNTVTNG